MENLKKVFAGMLLDIKAIKLQPNEPFTWASGWKSPFYCDNRKTLSYHNVRSFVKLELTHAVMENFSEAEAVAGVATGAIAQGALVADELALPYAYVRPKPKDHGMKNQIEGQLPEGAKVVVVEDLISTGGSSLKAVAALREAGFNVIGMVASYTYGFPIAEQAFKDANVKLVTLTNYESVVEKRLRQDISTKTTWPCCTSGAATPLTGRSKDGQDRKQHKDYTPLAAKRLQPAERPVKRRAYQRSPAGG